MVGHKGVGKDTAGDYLVHKYGFTKIAFADPLKRVCSLLFNISSDHFEDQNLKECIVTMWGQTPRQMMQQVGTDIVRKHLGDDFWIRHVEQRLETLQGDVVICDVRFKIEADFIKRRGGVLIKLQSEKPTTATDTHVSETEQEYITADYCILNTANNRENMYSYLEKALALRV